MSKKSFEDTNPGARHIAHVCRLPLCALLLGLWFAPRTAAADPVSLNVLPNSLIVVPVHINGEGPYDFLLDTGANTTIIHLEFARRIKLRAVDRIELLTVAGAQIVPRSFIKEMRIGRAQVMEVEALWSELKEVRSSAPGVCGVIGGNFLARFNYLLDRRGGRLEFEEAGEIASRLSGRRVPAARVSDRTIVRLSGARLVLDSGASHLVLFTRDGAGLESVGFGLARTDAGVSRVGRGRLARLQVGDRSLRDLTIALAPRDAGRVEDGLLPLSLFGAIYVNHQSGYVIFDPR